MKSLSMIGHCLPLRSLTVLAQEETDKTCPSAALTKLDWDCYFILKEHHTKSINPIETGAEGISCNLIL